MTAMRVMGAVVMVSILTGCTAVYSPRPMGAAPLVLQEDAWEGQWLFEDGALTIGAADPGKGLLKLAWI
ncbi:hypothetical protein JW905_05660, partial [bacterium]|nr:hypothetical protein [candidate division CSSED10-310 bacterium]